MSHLKSEPGVGDDVVAESPLVDFRIVREQAEFRELRSKHRRFVFPVVMGALGWYFLYILLGAYAHEFMSIQAFGNITVGLVMALSQIVMTFGVALLYVVYGNRVLDPAASRLREDLEARIDAPSQDGARK